MADKKKTVLNLGNKMKAIDLKVKCADCINCGGACKYGKGFEQYKPRECDHYMFYD